MNVRPHRDGTTSCSCRSRSRRPAIAAAIPAALAAALAAAGVMQGAARAQRPNPTDALGQPLPGDASGALETAQALRGAAARAQTELPNWYQVMGSNYLGARLYSVVVDPRDSRRIFVGTEQGTILKSEDAGITWNELAVRSMVIRTQRDQGPPPLQFNFAEDTDLMLLPRVPFRLSSPTIALFEGMPTVSPTALQEYRSGATQAGLTPAFEEQRLPAGENEANAESRFGRRAQDRNLLGSRLRGWPASDLVRLVVVTAIEPTTPTVLRDSLRSRTTERIERIAICPGAKYELLATSNLELFGSDDDGQTWLPLLRLPSTGRIEQVACTAARPDDIFVSTDLGIFYSNDGGETIDLDTSGFPPGSAIAMHLSDEGQLTVSIGYQLFEGNPQDGFEKLYPRFEDSHTAPWLDIEWVDRDGEIIWIATRDGLRASLDGGETWENVSPTRFSRYYMTVVRIVPDGNGGRTVAALGRVCPPRVQGPLWEGCTVTEVLSTTDDGETWHPFFVGPSGRTVQFLDYVEGDEEHEGRWLVLSAGQLWASSSLGETIFAPEHSAWAREQMDAFGTLEDATRRTLSFLELDVETLEALYDRSRMRGFVPKVQALFRYITERRTISTTLAPNPQRFDENYTDPEWTFLVQLEWSLYRTIQTPTQVERDTRWGLYVWRRRIEYIVEDAWHERRVLLNRLIRGTENLLQAQIIRARIASLDTLLEFYTGRMEF